jgi:hypothetical protein
MFAASHCLEMPIAVRFAARAELEFNKAQKLSEGEPDMPEFMPELSAHA